MPVSSGQVCSGLYTSPHPPPPVVDPQAASFGPKQNLHPPPPLYHNLTADAQERGNTVERGNAKYMSYRNMEREGKIEERGTPKPTGKRAHLCCKEQPNHFNHEQLAQKECQLTKVDKGEKTVHRRSISSCPPHYYEGNFRGLDQEVGGQRV